MCVCVCVQENARKKKRKKKNVTNTLSRQYFMGGNAYCVAKRELHELLQCPQPIRKSPKSHTHSTRENFLAGSITLPTDSTTLCPTKLCLELVRSGQCLGFLARAFHKTHYITWGGEVSYTISSQ